jgi:hypothetical protein
MDEQEWRAPHGPRVPLRGRRAAASEHVVALAGVAD